MQHGDGRLLSLSVQGRRGGGLLSQIEQDVLDEGKSIGSALRRCMLLGSRTGSSQLRDWATLELKGYPVPAEVPDYRVIAAGLHLDLAVPLPLRQEPARLLADGI
jgi:AbiTii